MTAGLAVRNYVSLDYWNVNNRPVQLGAEATGLRMGFELAEDSNKWPNQCGAWPVMAPFAGRADEDSSSLIFSSSRSVTSRRSRVFSS